MLLSLSVSKKLSLIAIAALQGVLAADNHLIHVTGDIGANPNNVGMYVYMPSKLAYPAPLIVAIHGCGGSAQAYFKQTQYANLADEYSYIVIYPNSPRGNHCFDVNTNATLAHNGGGDSQGIASMISHSIAHLGGDARRVYVTGVSSGGMMTNVMAGSYPNLFQAASVYSGAPFGCFAGPNEWNTACAMGWVVQTPERWGDLVRAAYPGYSGARPRMLIWHGGRDNVLYPQNFWEEFKQWTNVFGYSQKPTKVTNDDPVPGYLHWGFGKGDIQTYAAPSVGHPVPCYEMVDLAWFGIAGTYNISWESEGNGVSDGDGVGGAESVRLTNTETMEQIPLSFSPK